MSKPQHAHRIAAAVTRQQRYDEPAIPNGDGIEPTIRSVSGGIWSSPECWQPPRVPAEDDVVGLHRGHHIFASPADVMPAHIVMVD